MSGVDLPGRKIRKGSPGAIETYVAAVGGVFPEAVREAVRRVAKDGGTPLLVAEEGKVLGTVWLKDIVKGGIKERFAELRRMEQLLVNLLENVAKYTPPGSPVHIAARQKDDSVELIVDDRGPGIPQEALEKVFNIFYRVPGEKRPRGYGLGLAISRAVAIAHGPGLGRCSPGRPAGAGPGNRTRPGRPRRCRG